MPLDPIVMNALAMRCAPAVSPITLRAVARVESRFEPLAIGVNGPSPYRVVPRTLTEATGEATRLIAAGANVDLGLLQINRGNLERLGLSIPDAFDPCRNLRAAATLLKADYRLGKARQLGEQAALRIALSYYNTGKPDRGFRNGYVARVTGAAATPPRIQDRSAGAPAAAPAWDVFASTSPATVFVTASSIQGDPR